MDNEQLLKEIIINQSVIMGLSALLTSLIEEMDAKGLIDGNNVMDRYVKNIEAAKIEMKKLEEELKDE
jgi:hypothetical protein